MKKLTAFLKNSAFVCGSMLFVAVAFSACSNDNDEPNKKDDQQTETDSKTLDYTVKNADSWHNYSVKVAELLARDSEDLYNSWAAAYDGEEAFANSFKNPSASGIYKSYLECIEEILGGCADIANEVGEAKIGDPYNLFVAGRTEEGLYAVESWYSWHSREDYSNNIYSIRNSYYGSRDNKVAANSMATLVKTQNPDLNAAVVAAIDAAAKAILDIPQPFRNNINSHEAVNAMNACADLERIITNQLTPFFLNLDTSFDGDLQKIVENYVDAVVLPTYAELKERNAAMLTAVKNLASKRNDAAFEAACNSWLSAREPWEKSEAFLFGPVDNLGLDPNMDSWPLDQDMIVNHLNSGNFADLEWGDGDDDNKVEAAQNIRGFHTLEFLLFKDGQPRKVNN